MVLFEAMDQSCDVAWIFHEKMLSGLFSGMKPQIYLKKENTACTSQNYDLKLQTNEKHPVKSRVRVVYKQKKIKNNKA